MKKVLITFSRQFGTGAQGVAKKVAESYGIPYYDNESMAKLMHPDGEKDEEYFGQSGERIDAENDYLNYTMIVGGEFVRYTSVNEKMFDEQSKLMSKIADEGSAIFVGRCADDVLIDYDGLVRIYLYAPLEKRIKNVMERQKLGEKDAKKLIRRMDRAREAYYKHYTDKVWGLRDNYDLCVDVSDINEDAVVGIVKAYVDGMK